MSKYLERSKELRAMAQPHINCTQGVVMPFAEEAGLTEEQVQKIFANFGGGMRRASQCGAVTGGIAVLGMFGADDISTVGEYYRILKERHEGMLDCADLLKASAVRGEVKKVHCDGLVFECLTLAEEMLRERGLLPD